jgi:hypothetical protein
MLNEDDAKHLDPRPDTVALKNYQQEPIAILISKLKDLDAEHRAATMMHYLFKSNQDDSLTWFYAGWLCAKDDMIEIKPMDNSFSQI